MNFSEAESYLLSLGNEVETMKLGLDNIRRLLSALGDPQNNYLKVQVAGTNGKGSVCAFLDAICNEARIPTGTFTSPHLISITERIRINGSDISEADFARHATTVRETAERLVVAGELEYTATFFEQVTAIALLAFADARVELAILETGMGGRYDATTAANAEIAAITRIDLDHQQYLGETLEEIAAEKAAIIHSDSKAVVLHQQRKVEQVIAGHCREMGLEPSWATTNIIIRKVDESLGIPLHTFSFTTEYGNYPNIEPRMRGRHQAENMSIAIAVCEALTQTGIKISDSAICLGLETANHPGRLEYIGNVLLDGAHNAGGAQALADYVRESEPQPITLVFGSMNDKNVAEMLSTLAPLSERIILTKPSNSRAISADELLAEMPSDLTHERVSITGTVAEALDIAPRVTSDEGLILVAGSLYLVGEARRILLERSEI